jgi:phosphocarrier protein HPr
VKEQVVAHRNVVIASKVGLHARPAALFTRAATAGGLQVTIRKGDGAPVSAASILSVLTLNVGCGDEVVLEAEGDGAERLLDDLAALLAQDLDA